MPASPPVLTTFANPDPEAAPLNIQQLVQLLNTLVSSAIQGDYIPYVIQHETPGPDDRDKAWIFTDTQGRPIETRIWWANSGMWRRIYNGMVGEVRMYQGDPTVDFDTNGLGIPGGNFDGWHLCNGQDGVEDLSDRFLLAAHMNNASVNGYQPSNGGWVSTEVHDAGEHTGGFRQITLDGTNTYIPPTQEITLYEWSATGNAPANPGDLYGVHNVSAKADTLQNGSTGNTTPNAINIINPFIAIGYITFVGYSS